MEFDNIFNSTVLVLWAVFLIPYALREDKLWIIGVTGAVMLVIEVALSMAYAHREFPFNFVAGILNFFVGLGVGYVVHYFQSKGEKDKS